MKRIEFGKDGTPQSMHLVEEPRPEPGLDELLIEVHFAGVNRPDLMQRAGRYDPPPGASPILGLEVSGLVVAVGANVRDWSVGDPVCALVPGGGYAQFCCTPAGQALPIPAGLSLAEAAGLPETWFTVWANVMDLGHLRRGERLLVHGGSSGIGIAALQLAKHVGASSYATAGSPEKARFCLEFGAEAAIEYRKEDFVKRIGELTAGEGVDVVLDMVGGSYTPRNLSILRRDGRLVQVAFLQGSAVQIDLGVLMRKRLLITGSTMRPRPVAEKTAIRDALAREIWPAFGAGRIHTHVHATFPLAQAADAHRLMESDRHMGKIVLSVKE